MAYKIDAGECTSCGACADVCPVTAISEGDAAYVIDPETCTDCGACEGECPVSAISQA
jgi:ferredoxin